MKTCLLMAVAVYSLTVSVFAAPPTSEKQFQSGVSGLGYRWDYCREGKAVRYAVFAYGPRPREMGESKSGAWVEVSGAGSRKPQATLRLTAKERRDLFAEGDRIYQIGKDGQMTAYDERVTAAEWNAFMASHPQQYTAQALLAFVQQQRAARE